MKKWLVLAGIVTVLVVVAHASLSFFGVKFLNRQLGNLLGPGATISTIEIRPTYLSVKGFRYRPFHMSRSVVEIEELKAYPKLFSFLRGIPSIRKLIVVKPSFLFYRSHEGTWVGALPLPKMGGRGDVQVGQNGDRDRIEVRIDRIQILEGRIDVEDWKPGTPAAKIHFRNFELEMEGLRFPAGSDRCPFTLKGSIKGPSRDGKVETRGWINLRNLDMDTLLRINNLDLKTLEPYYRKRISARIDSGYLDLESKIHVRNKVINAPVRLELADLRIKDGGTIFWVPAKTLISLLRERDNRIKLDFRLDGNLDDPRFSLQESLLNRAIISLAETFGIPLKVLGENVLGGSLQGAKGLADTLRSIEELFGSKREK